MFGSRRWRQGRYSVRHHSGASTGSDLAGATRRDVLRWGAVGATALVLSSCGGSPRRVQALKDRAWMGVNHPLASLAQLETTLAYKFPVVGGLYYTFDSVWARHTQDLKPAAGRELMVCWMPQSDFGDVILADIPAGKYDAHIDEMLTGMRTFDGTVIIRWGHEANGNWYPWAAASSAGAAINSTPQHYVEAWRYIVGRDRRIKGRSNIKWFWCANARDVASASGQLYPLERYWPGADWVDFVGCDGYNEPTAWDSFDAVFRDPYQRISALSPKPFWIGEVGCHEPLSGQPESKGAWIAAMLDSRSFPNMQAVCYFDYDSTPASRADWRFDSSPATLASVIASFKTVPRRVS